MAAETDATNQIIIEIYWDGDLQHINWYTKKVNRDKRVTNKGSSSSKV